MSGIRSRLKTEDITKLLDQTVVNDLILAGTVNSLVNSSTVNSKVTVSRINEIVAGATVSETIVGLVAGGTVAGGVGSYAFAQVDLGGPASMTLGDTSDGQYLMLATSYGAINGVNLGAGTVWACMGETTNRDDDRNEISATLFKRIS